MKWMIPPPFQPLTLFTEHLLHARPVSALFTPCLISPWQQLKELTPLNYACLPDEESEPQRLSDFFRVSQLVTGELGWNPVVPQSTERERAS